MDYSSWKPVAPWSGRLILPPYPERRADGGILILVENAPEPWSSLVGTTCVLAGNPDSAWARYTAREIPGVRSVQHVPARAADARDLPPARLDGWLRPSPLETLAGSLPADDVRVSLSQPAVVRVNAVTTLFIDDEPVQIEGRYKALARFERPLDEVQSRWLVRHWDTSAHDFTGAEDIVRWIPARLPACGDLPQTGLERIHKTAVNRYGWYLYADLADDDPADARFPGEPVLRAIEPRAIRSASLAPAIPQPLRDYLAHGLWDGSSYGTWFQSTVPPAPQPESPALIPATASGPSPAAFKPGDRGLAIHLSGWRSGPRCDPSDETVKVTGHVSCGFYAIVIDPFTDEAAIDLVYARAYNRDPEGVVAGFIASHACLGSLERGWLWLAPVSDALIHHPAFEPGGALPLASIRLSLARMVARTRSSTTTTSANTADSCARNTAIALYEASLGDETRPDSDTALALCRMLSPFGFGIFRLLSPRWIAYLEDRRFKRFLPRALHDALARTFHERGASLRFVRTNQLGGRVDGIEPHRPVTLKDPFSGRQV